MDDLANITSGPLLTKMPPYNVDLLLKTILVILAVIIVQVAEVLPNDDAEDILRMTRSRLETYLKEVSPEDLKRSPETRAALFGAMDHVRCLVLPVYPHEILDA